MWLSFLFSPPTATISFYLISACILQLWATGRRGRHHPTQPRGRSSGWGTGEGGAETRGQGRGQGPPLFQQKNAVTVRRRELEEHNMENVSITPPAGPPSPPQHKNTRRNSHSCLPPTLLLTPTPPAPRGHFSAVTSAGRLPRPNLTIERVCVVFSYAAAAAETGAGGATKKKNRRPFPHYSFVVASAPLCSPWVWLPLPFAPSGLFSILENMPDFLREKTTLPGKKNREDGGRRRGTAPGPRRRKKQHKKKLCHTESCLLVVVFFTLTLCLVFPEKKCTFFL